MYRPLDSSKRTIRTLIADPKSPQHDASPDVQYVLEEIHLDDPAREPYHALSYVWGDPSVKDIIRVNGASIEVTTNLASALRHVRQTNGALRLWVDSVCINQADSEEKGSQVAMMTDIYRDAESVIVWLGDGTDDSGLAMRTVREWGPPEFKHDRHLLDIFMKSGFDGLERKWTALNKLFSRPYWSRRWVFQEILLGRSVKLHCGSDVVDWDDFKGLEEAWYQTLRKVDGHLPITRQQQDTIKDSGIGVLQTFTNFDEKNKWKKARRDMSGLLQGTTHLKCSDPRDHIYSLMGIAKDAENYPAPDYSRKVEDVYIEFARAHIRQAGTLDIIGEAVIRAHARDQEATQSLPPWVPDWRTKPEGMALHRSPDTFNACKGCEMVNWGEMAGAWEQAGQPLSTRGIIIDTIDVVHDSKETLSSPVTMMWVLIHGITTGRDPSHPSGFPFLNVLFKTVLLDIDYRLRGQDVSLTSEEVTMPDIFFQLAEAFLLLVCLQWGHLRDVVFPGETEQAMFDLNLRFLPEGSDLAHRYPKFETVKAFREAVRAEGQDSLSLTMYVLPTVQEAIAKYTTSGRALIETDKELFGLATPTTRAGDVVAVIRGYRAPVILRQKSEGVWFLVGDAFVYGLMDGEAFDTEHKRLDMDLPDQQDFLIY
ncbi:hypothetical protein NKR23_g371 [Pleurostoma richardsiae]|uniref:Heterokaryon incompatibility domain-containing protein n=1 Tax=Pleurostoma richardsiae TaxID=41990 RepID=A0AA38S2E7_9PEZI|nr:hypothetical protein NKR23_g371 [Pleurostoma richardsiae]